MTFYAYNPATGELIRTDVVADWMGVTEVPPPDFDARAAGCFWRDGAWVVAPAEAPVEPVPQSITRAQARAALIVSGLIGLVQPAIDAIEDPVQRALAQNDWDERLHFERSNPTLLSLAASLGWNDDQLDELFRLGATL